VALPESPDAIEEEIKKQESLLAGEQPNFDIFVPGVASTCAKLQISP